MNRLPGFAALMTAAFFFAPGAMAQAPAPAPAAAAAPAAAPDGDAPLTQEQLDQLVAPIALYPDDLLAQVLMASTYPIEIVQADRWTKAHKDLTGDALAKAVDEQTWDTSVKSLVQFPDVLSMMSDKLDITSKLGDAFIAQQKDVMDAIQRLRNKAQAAGNLQSNQQQTVTINQAPAGAAAPQTIVIQPANPEVVYVPQYNPSVVYGAWPYPSYPPYPYYPPGYVAGAAALSFGVGVACGAIWSNNWNGNCNWNGGSVNINNNFNRNTNIQGGNRTNVQGGNRANVQGGSQWQHNPQHRQGAPYANRSTAQKYGGVDRAQASQARDQYRGRDAGAGQSANRPGQGAGNRPAQQPGAGANRPSGGQAGNRPAQQPSAGNRPAGNQGAARPSTQPANRPSGGQGNALSGANRSGASTQAASNRGNASRSSSAASRPSGGASRPSGGGGSRGGGGGRGGGGRR